MKGEVKDVDDALKGARDIIAEQVNEDERARNAVRNQFGRQAEITAKLVKGKEEEAAKYRDYFDFSEPLKRCTSHRLLAIRRAGVGRVAESVYQSRRRGLHRTFGTPIRTWQQRM